MRVARETGYVTRCPRGDGEISLWGPHRTKGEQNRAAERRPPCYRIELSASGERYCVTVTHHDKTRATLLSHGALCEGRAVLRGEPTTQATLLPRRTPYEGRTKPRSRTQVTLLPHRAVCDRRAMVPDHFRQRRSPCYRIRLRARGERHCVVRYLRRPLFHRIHIDQGTSHSAWPVKPISTAGHPTAAMNSMRGASNTAQPVGFAGHPTTASSSVRGASNTASFVNTVIKKAGNPTTA
jgi:hypothetical protein